MVVSVFLVFVFFYLLGAPSLAVSHQEDCYSDCAAKVFVQATPVVLTRQKRSHRIIELYSVAVEVAARAQQPDRD